MPTTCIPQACLAYGVTQADVSGFANISAVPPKYLIPPEQSIDNMLKDYLDGTPVAAVFGGTPGDIPQNYFQLYDYDVLYATAHMNDTAQIVQADGTLLVVSVQDLLNLGSQKILSIAEGAAPSGDGHSGDRRTGRASATAFH